jgi:hypothetical protein
VPTILIETQEAWWARRKRAFARPTIRYHLSAVIACDKREAFAQGSEATKQSIPHMRRDGLLRSARNDGGESRAAQ